MYMYIHICTHIELKKHPLWAIHLYSQTHDAHLHYEFSGENVSSIIKKTEFYENVLHSLLASCSLFSKRVHLGFGGRLGCLTANGAERSGMDGRTPGHDV